MTLVTVLGKRRDVANIGHSIRRRAEPAEAATPPEPRDGQSSGDHQQSAKRGGVFAKQDPPTAENMVDLKLCREGWKPPAIDLGKSGPPVGGAWAHQLYG